MFSLTSAKWLSSHLKMLLAILVWNSYHSFYCAIQLTSNWLLHAQKLLIWFLSFTDPPPPAQPTVQFNNAEQSFTVSWNNITSPFNGYTVAVSPFNPCNEPPDVSCNTTYVCSGWSASSQPNMLEFSVNAVCGSVVGRSNAAATVNLQSIFYCSSFPR